MSSKIYITLYGHYAIVGTLEFYNELASKENRLVNNGRLFGLHSAAEKRIFRDIQWKLDFRKSDSVLDLGSGTGRIAKHIAPLCREIILADGAPNALETAEKIMAGSGNALFAIVDVNVLPLPFPSNRFDKTLCYSVVHSSIESHKEFLNLVRELVRITKPAGKVLIGDIPLQEKYEEYLARRKMQPFKNFLFNQKYRLRKMLTEAFYRIRGIDQNQARGLNFTKRLIQDLLDGEEGIAFAFSIQNARLPFAASREDLLITKLESQ